MSAVTQCKACLRALDLMLADNLTAAEAHRRTVQALCVAQGLQLPENLPRSTLKKLVLELKVPYHLGAAYSRVLLTCPLSDEACAVHTALDKVFSCLPVDATSPAYSSSLATAVQQQLLRSGLVQHMPALLEAAASRLEALAGAAAAAAASAGQSADSAQQGHGRSSSGDDIVATSCRDDGDAIVRVTRALDVVVHVVAFIAHGADSQRLDPQFPTLAASVLHLALAAFQYFSSRLQHLKQQQQQGTQLAAVVFLHFAIRRALHSIVWVMQWYKGVDRQQPPAADVLLQSPHSLPCLAAAITLECAALEARQQGVAPQWSEEDPSAAALQYWQQSCGAAGSLGIAARWLQQALGLAPRAVQFAVTCLRVKTDLKTLQDLLSLFYLLAVLRLPQQQQQQQQRRAVMQPRVQCGQQGVQQLQWLLLVPAAVAQLSTALVQQATPEVWRFTANTTALCYTLVANWVATAPQVQQAASQLLQALSQQQGTALPCALPAWYVDVVLPPLLSTATKLQQALQAEAGDKAAAVAAGGSRANQELALQAFSAVGYLLCCCLHHAMAVSSAPGIAVAGTAAATVSVLGSSSSSSSPEVDPSACEAWADLSAPLTQVDNADMLPPGSQVVIPHAVAEHAVQVMTALTALVRATLILTVAAATPTGNQPIVKLELLRHGILLSISELCEGRGPEYRGRTPLLLMVGAAGSCQGVAEQQLQGLLVSMLKPSGAAAAVQPEAALGDVRQVVALCHNAALSAAAAGLDAVSQQLTQVTEGSCGGGGGGGGDPAAAGCTEVAPKDMVQEGAAGSSAASCADISRKLPYLVVIGRWSLQCSQMLQQQVGTGAEAHSTPAAAAASSQGSSPTPGCGLTVGELKTWLSACRAVAAWLNSSNHTARLRKAGYNLEPFHHAYLRVADMGADDEAAEQPVVAEHLPELVQQLAVVGQVLTLLATPVMCNNPVCTNLSGLSELQLVSGRSCICAGCHTARYCSRACQTRHWKQHKSVCKALAAAAAAAGTAPATAAAPAAS